ncbi:MAG: hypothetical protein QOI08_1479, partial [Actinomycetota bacterium]|nr:hypothetical protein [Actinomycetota bacterium]
MSAWDSMEHAHAMTHLQAMLAQRPMLEAGGRGVRNHHEPRCAVDDYALAGIRVRRGQIGLSVPWTASFRLKQSAYLRVVRHHESDTIRCKIANDVHGTIF